MLDLQTSGSVAVWGGGGGGGHPWNVFAPPSIPKIIPPTLPYPPSIEAHIDNHPEVFHHLILSFVNGIDGLEVHA